MSIVTQIDDLYSEVLYALVHPRRFRETQPEIDALVAHLQQVFHIDNDKHAKLLDNAKEKQAPPLVLNLEVVEAKGLKGKDVNGMNSLSFDCNMSSYNVTMVMESNNNGVYNIERMNLLMFQMIMQD